VSESFHSDAPPPTQRDDAIQPAEGRRESHVLAEKSATAPPEMFAHRWGRKALRESLLFLLVAVVVLVICGLFLPVPGEVFWRLVLIVVGVGAAIGAGFYLFNVVPRLLIALIVWRYNDIPWARRLKREKAAFFRGSIFTILLGLVGAAIEGPGGRAEDVAAFGVLFCWAGGLLWYSVVYVWNHYVNVILRRYSLSPPSDLPPEGEEDEAKPAPPPDSDPELEPPLFADTDIISSRAPARPNAAPTDIQPGDPSP
jgi:hypothetical protein